MWPLSLHIQVNEVQGVIKSAPVRPPMCKELGVELLFEDDPQVLCPVDPAIVSMMVVNHEEHKLARLSS